ncbi:MAG: hypothetical protein U0640_13180 [Phycisphaerales bacterium]
MSERPAMQCLSCKYDLSGLPDGVCPECGATFSLAMFEMMERVKAEKRAEFREMFRMSARNVLAVVSVLLALFYVGSMDQVGAAVLLVCLLWSLLAATHSSEHGKRQSESPMLIVFPVIPAMIFGWVVGAMQLRAWIAPHFVCTLSVVLAVMSVCRNSQTAFVLGMIAIVPLHVRAVWMTLHAIVRRNKGWCWTDFDWSVPHQTSSRHAASISTDDALWLGPTLILVSTVLVVVVWIAVPRLTRARQR